MAGAYTHLTVVNSVSQRLLNERDSDFDLLIQDKLKFIELGSVSPDYPLLRLPEDHHSEWGYIMHSTGCDEFIKNGIILCKEMYANIGTHNISLYKSLAWLLGYVSHITTDAVVHPVVNLKVGDYNENAMEHRICEMNQDVHIFSKFMKNKLTAAEHIDSGIMKCNDNSLWSKILNLFSIKRIDRDIYNLWNECLRRTYTSKFHENKPNIDNWHNYFIKMQDFADNGWRPLYRNFNVSDFLGQSFGAKYPVNVNKDFILNLTTPNGVKCFDDIFEKAVDNVYKNCVNVLDTVIGKCECNLTYANPDTGFALDGSTYVYW